MIFAPDQAGMLQPPGLFHANQTHVRDKPSHVPWRFLLPLAVKASVSRRKKPDANKKHSLLHFTAAGLKPVCPQSLRILSRSTKWLLQLYTASYKSAQLCKRNASFIWFYTRHPSDRQLDFRGIFLQPLAVKWMVWFKKHKKLCMPLWAWWKPVPGRQAPRILY